MNDQWIAQVLCEKNKDESGGGKLKKITFNTLDKTHLLIGRIGSQFSGENFLIELEKLAQNPLKNLRENNPQKPQFIGLEKLAVGSQVA